MHEMKEILMGIIENVKLKIEKPNRRFKDF